MGFGAVPDDVDDSTDDSEVEAEGDERLTGDGYAPKEQVPTDNIDVSIASASTQLNLAKMTAQGHDSGSDSDTEDQSGDDEVNSFLSRTMDQVLGAWAHGCLQRSPLMQIRSCISIAACIWNSLLLYTQGHRQPDVKRPSTLNGREG